MRSFSQWVYGWGWPVHAVIAVVILGAIWFVVRRFDRLKPYSGQMMVLLSILYMGILFYIITFSFRVPMFSGTPAYLIPRIWFFALLPSVAVALFPIFTGKEDKDPKWGNVRLVGIVLTTLVVGIGLFPYIGYYISSAVMIVLLMWILGSRSKVELISVPVGWVAFSYFVFARLLNVRLPVGVWIENIFSL